ncbi:hypothetical protein [Streptomyces noursei]|uniref:Uncharacterized protein n=1 Tax=Streptomyces noursei TaxID=1971 RepID=A0A2N8PIG8_STRNR|nr:hypothetical protein [Streptomyces noursei]PNE40844.1 hypothetical protein AOB60_08645 [Streptomyces noursei]
MPVDDARLVEKQQTQIAAGGQVVDQVDQLGPQRLAQAVQLFLRTGMGPMTPPLAWPCYRQTSRSIAGILCGVRFDVVVRVRSDRGWLMRTSNASRPRAGSADTPDG